MGRPSARLRQAREYSQRELARRAGVDHNTVAKIESGERGKRPSAEVLAKLAAALGVPLQELIF